MMRNFVSLKDVGKNGIERLLVCAALIKKSPSSYENSLKGTCAALLFQKPSLRTKTSFYVGALQLGAQVVYFSPNEVRLGERENVSDAARTLSGYLDVVVLRTYAHRIVEEFAGSATCAVVNGLSDLLHPSQVLGDLLTISETGRKIHETKVAFIGDGNNVCHSLMYAFSLIGGILAVATPSGYGPRQTVCDEVMHIAQETGAQITVTQDPSRAVKGADVLYTDVWASMGKEDEQKKRAKVFSPYRIDSTLLKVAKDGALVMHCLPAHRGEEITDAVIDGPNSVVFQQAQNRLHSAKAVLLYALGKKI